MDINPSLPFSLLRKKDFGATVAIFPAGTHDQLTPCFFPMYLAGPYLPVWIWLLYIILHRQFPASVFSVKPMWQWGNASPIKSLEIFIKSYFLDGSFLGHLHSGKIFPMAQLCQDS